MTAPDDWGDRFKAARKAAGYSSAGKFAAAIGASERQAIRWENAEGLPTAPRHLKAIRKVSAAFAGLLDEIPDEESRRARLAQRVAAAEKALADQTARRRKLEKTVDALSKTVEALEHRIAALEQAPARRAPRGQPR